MLQQALALELDQDVDQVQSGIDQVAEDEINDAIAPAKRYRRLRAFFGQGIEPRPFAARQHECYHPNLHGPYSGRGSELLANPCLYGARAERDNGATRATVAKAKMDRAEILTRLRERIVRYAASQLRGSSTGDLAQDLAQEVLIVLHQKYSELDRIEDLLPLSLEIARLKIWAVRRKSHRRGEDRQIPVEDLPLAGGGADPFEQASRRERAARLESALSKLGERCRELFRLKLE